MGLHRAAGRGSCFIHAGTHKTGTTAIQRYLASNRQHLARAGLYYPAAAVLSEQLPGHHNIAFELTGDPRFDRTAGTLADVLRELAQVGPQNACLSSEAFESFHVDRGAMVSLRDAIAALGYRPRIVLYVRPQDDYVESLYAELVKHGILRPFEDVLSDVMAHGVVRHDRAWVSRFDYTKLAAGFARVFGRDAVVVRAYRNDGAPDALVNDFLAAVGLDAPDPSGDGAQPAMYDNFRLTTGGVIAWLFRNIASSLGDERIAAAGAELVARYPRDASEPFRPLTPRARAAVVARFAEDNTRLARRWPASAGIAFRQPVELEPEQARGARRLFERAMALQRAAFDDARGGRTPAASGG